VCAGLNPSACLARSVDSSVVFPAISLVTGTPGKTSRISSADVRVITVSAAAMMKLPLTSASSESLQAVAASRSSM
jgi:hypothetical protein